jgi:LytS/YehU family sensor histidine kinase
LNAGERDFSRLADELQFVRLYLELQQKRFADRLTVILPPPSDVVDAWVPSLILQPLVENAVVHGLSGHQGPVRVQVSVEKSNEVLLLRVINTISPGKLANADGIGIRNVRERLAVQFEGRAALTAGAADNEWVSEISLPEIHASPDRRSIRHVSSWAAA